MHKVSGYLFYHLVALCGISWLIAILVFLFAYYVLYWRKDYQTAIEVTCIAWLLTFYGVARAFMGSFRIMGGIPKWWEMQIYQYLPFISILLIPTLFTIPIVWSCLQPRAIQSLGRSRLLVMAVFIGFFDVLLYVWYFVPLWGWDFNPPEF